MALLCTRVHGRFNRSVVEHVFAQMKRFEVLNGKFRGRLCTEKGAQRLGDALTVVSALIALQVEQSSLRSAEPLVAPEVQAAFDAAAAAGAAADLAAPRVMRHGFPCGDPELDLVEEGGEYRGLGPQPSDAAVQSGNEWDDFAPRQRVWVWWWGSLWKARVERRQQRKRALVVKFDATGQTVPDYLPRLLWLL